MCTWPSKRQWDSTQIFLYLMENARLWKNSSFSILQIRLSDVKVNYSETSEASASIISCKLYKWCCISVWKDNGSATTCSRQVLQRNDTTDGVQNSNSLGSKLSPSQHLYLHTSTDLSHRWTLPCSLRVCVWGQAEAGVGHPHLPKPLYPNYLPSSASQSLALLWCSLSLIR